MHDLPVDGIAGEPPLFSGRNPNDQSHLRRPERLGLSSRNREKDWQNLRNRQRVGRPWTFDVQTDSRLPPRVQLAKRHRLGWTEHRTRPFSHQRFSGIHCRAGALSRPGTPWEASPMSLSLTSPRCLRRGTIVAASKEQNPGRYQRLGFREFRACLARTSGSHSGKSWLLPEPKSHWARVDDARLQSTPPSRRWQAALRFEFVHDSPIPGACANPATGGPIHA